MHVTNNNSILSMLLTGVTTPTHSNWQFTDDQIPLHSHQPLFWLGQKTVMGSIVGGLGL